MNDSNRGTMVTGLILVILGVLFFILNLIPGISAAKTWPMILILLAIGFFIPSLIWPKSREGLAGLFIPGCILLTLGAIFLFNTLTKIWNIWAFAWLLIPASVGLGLVSGATVGKWDRSVKQVGFWMMVISLTAFALFASLFGTPVVKAIGAGFLLVSGAFLLIRSLIKKPTAG